MSNALPLLARCQPSIFACSVHRARRAARGSLGRELLEDGGKPGPERVRREIPDFGVASLGDEIEQNGGDLQSVGIDTSHDGLSQRNGAFTALFSNEHQQKARQRAAFTGSFSLKATAR
jgi:hypothetical protein